MDMTDLLDSTTFVFGYLPEEIDFSDLYDGCTSKGYIMADIPDFDTYFIKKETSKGLRHMTITKTHDPVCNYVLTCYGTDKEGTDKLAQHFIDNTNFRIIDEVPDYLKNADLNILVDVRKKDIPNPNLN